MALTHFDSQGQATMVDVASKHITLREAVAQARVVVGREVMRAVLEQNLPKGDLFATARIAGIQGAKKTAELVPLCHPLMLSQISLDFAPDPSRAEIRIACRVKCNGRTGVEMEALTGAAVAALTIYDMVKGLDKGAVIQDVRLLTKSGGKAGDWSAAEGVAAT